MTTWRIQLRPLSPWATPWRADSIFGSVCWKWLELFPETFESMLEGFSLEEFSQADNPPFVLSDAWPGDLLPLPAHIPPAPFGQRKLKPPFFISSDTFDAINAGQMQAAPVVHSVVVPSARIQTSIDRDKGSALDGQLFETDTSHLGNGFDTLSLYVRSDRYLKQVIACLRALALVGFGKKSSTGLGQFEVMGQEEPCGWLDCLPSSSGWVSLSHFVPARADPTDGHWRTHVTSPKFHSNSSANVFKGTFLMLTPGSVFRSNDQEIKSWYGSMIPVPRPEMPKALHYALAFPVLVRWVSEQA